MGAKVLVVDDNHLNVRLLVDILEDEGFEVISTYEALNVLRIAHEENPDIILLDIMMPEMDGFQVCRLLKKDYETKDIPVIMVTAKMQSSDLKQALEAGAVDYIRKPIDEIEVVARVKAALRVKRQQDELKEMAMKDGLTGIYNHSLLMEFLRKEYNKHIRSMEDFCFVMLDIDHFKKVNDTYGHTAGDFVLKELSGVLLKELRKSDIVGRYGGEEFGIILPGANEADALKICERIRSRIEEHEFRLGDDVIRITVSIGIFCKKPNTVEAAPEIAKNADAALYMAKSNGRNRVELFR